MLEVLIVVSVLGGVVACLVLFLLGVDRLARVVKEQEQANGK